MGSPSSSRNRTEIRAKNMSISLRAFMAEMVGEDAIDSFLEQFEMGFYEELEHSATVEDDPVSIARIALDHLSEDPEYYTKLKKAGLTGD